MEPITKKVRVTIEKEIEITLTPKLFGEQSVDEYLQDFRECLWDVESINDVIEYAGRMAATLGGGYEHDGLGTLNTEWHNPDVIFDELYEDVEVEIIK